MTVLLPGRGTGPEVFNWDVRVTDTEDVAETDDAEDGDEGQADEEGHDALLYGDESSDELAKPAAPPQPCLSSGTLILAAIWATSACEIAGLDQVRGFGEALTFTFQLFLAGSKLQARIRRLVLVRVRLPVCASEVPGGRQAEEETGSKLEPVEEAVDADVENLASCSLSMSCSSAKAL